MTNTKEDKIIRFRKKLYQEKVPSILKSGGKDLNPMERSKIDSQGKILVLTSDIIDFFFSFIEKGDSLNPDQYISSLYLLFDVLTKEALNYSFQSDMRISEKDIQEADNKKTIQYLTKNLIISYFNQVKLPNGLVNTDLLDLEMKIIIKQSNEGRDYRTLIGKVLENLVKTLELAKPWRQSLEDIENAALVCRLVGSRLPQIEKTVLARIVSESRMEIKTDAAFFTKILNTRDQLAREEKNYQNYGKVMNKLDQATAGILKKINAYLGYAHRFIDLIGASPQGFLGRVDETLKKNTARLFFECQEEDPEKVQASPLRNFASSRYRMAMLFDYPELIKYSRSLQKDEKYRDCFLDCIKLYFDEFLKQMDLLLSSTGYKEVKTAQTRLSEIIRLVGALDLEPSALSALKQEVREKYLSLLKTTPFDHILPIIRMKENILIAVQEESNVLNEDIRKTLIDTCYERVTGLDIESTSLELLHQSVWKVLSGYAGNYRPQRFFYQRFCEQYIGRPDGTVSNHMMELVKSKKPIALKILEIFSDSKYVGDFILQEQIGFSGELLKRYREK